ncbi:MAG: hypothetical protein LBL51_06840, partial [Synergistaceae bacterium]|nr:hypothetical protein [Synergistaceae bacterium]
MKNLKNFMILFLLFLLYVLGVFLYDVLQKPQVASYWLLDYKMQGVRRSVYEIINEGYGVEVSADGKAIVSNKEEFIAGLKEVIYERNLEGRNWKEYFDAGVFKILVRDNFCSIRVDLDKASHHMSRDPLLTKRSLSDYAVRRSEDFFDKGIDRFG